jgi:hypothetical protein
MILMTQTLANLACTHEIYLYCEVTRCGVESTARQNVIKKFLHESYHPRAMSPLPVIVSVNCETIIGVYQTRFRLNFPYLSVINLHFEMKRPFLRNDFMICKCTRWKGRTNNSSLKGRRRRCPENYIECEF